MAKWITDMQSLLLNKICDNQLFMVKLLTVEDDDHAHIKVNSAVYPARLLHTGAKIEWYVSDRLDDYLIVTANDGDKSLGECTFTDEESNIYLSHIMSAFVPVQNKTKQTFSVVEKHTGKILGSFETKREADIIKRRLKKRGIAVNIDKIQTEILDISE